MTCSIILSSNAVRYSLLANQKHLNDHSTLQNIYTSRQFPRQLNNGSEKLPYTCYKTTFQVTDTKMHLILIQKTGQLPTP